MRCRNGSPTSRTAQGRSGRDLTTQSSFLRRISRTSGSPTIAREWDSNSGACNGLDQRIDRKDSYIAAAKHRIRPDLSLKVLSCQGIGIWESAEIRATLPKTPYERQICTEQKIWFATLGIEFDLLFVYIRSFLAIFDGSLVTCRLSGKIGRRMEHVTL